MNFKSSIIVGIGAAALAFAWPAAAQEQEEPSPTKRAPEEVEDRPEVEKPGREAPDEAVRHEQHERAAARKAESQRERGAEFRELGEHVGRLLRDRAELHRAGRHEEAEELSQEIEEVAKRHPHLVERLRGAGALQPPASSPDGGRGPGEIQELERRHRHLAEAHENLQAAGLHEMAEETRRQAEQVEREIHDRVHSGRPETGRPRRPVAQRPEAILGELKQEIAQLRKDVQELKGHANHDGDAGSESKPAPGHCPHCGAPVKEQAAESDDKHER